MESKKIKFKKCLKKIKIAKDEEVKISVQSIDEGHHNVT
jgi:hypothetical protein